MQKKDKETMSFSQISVFSSQRSHESCAVQHIHICLDVLLPLLLLWLAVRPKHPGIVDLRWTSKDDDNLYFVLEPLLGGPLHKHIRVGPNGCLEVKDGSCLSSTTMTIRYMWRVLTNTRTLRLVVSRLTIRDHFQSLRMYANEWIVPSNVATRSHSHTPLSRRVGQ